MNPIIHLRILSVALVIFSLGCIKQVTIHERKSDQTIISTQPEPAEIPQDHSARSNALVEKAIPLLTPTGMVFAKEIIDEALRLQPKNRKAQFYNAYLGPWLKLKGFLYRTELIRKEYPLNDKAVVLFDHLEFSHESFRTFLKDESQPQFQTEQDLRKFSLELLGEQKKLLEFIRANKDFTTNLKFNYINNFVEFAYTCGVTKISKGTYALDKCFYSSPFQVKMNRTDWEVLLLYLSTEHAGLALTTAYNPTGFLKIMLKDIPQNIKRNQLKNSKTFGALMSDHQLKDGIDSSSDIYMAIKYMKAMSKKFCNEDYIPREGHLVGYGICIGKTGALITDGVRRHYAMSSMLEVMAKNIQGQTAILPLYDKEHEVGTAKPADSVTLQLFAPFHKPLQDMRAQLPKAHNACGEITELDDKSLMGIFPSGDAEKFMVGDPECNPRVEPRVELAP